MNQYYAVEKESNKLKYVADSLYLLKSAIAKDEHEESEFYILGDINMKYVSRIVYIDGVCVYNNKDYWLNEAQNILDDYEEHEVLDILGQSVSKFRFETERNSNASRISIIDGRPGQVEYNIEIGQEMIALFKEECIVTDFKTITPLEIAAKLAPAYTLVLTGSFREAKTIFSQLDTDEFLTEERKQKYIDMLDSADAIEYAEPEEFIYTAGNNV